MRDQPALLKTAVALLVARALLGLLAFGLPVADPDEAQTMLIVGAFFVVLTLVVAYFVWQRRRWAAWLAIVVLGLDILLSLPLLFVGASAPFIAAGAVAVAIAIGVIASLLHRSVWPLLH